MTEPRRIVEDFSDRDRWNEFVLASAVGHLFQGWDWGEFQRGLGGQPHRIAAMSGDRIIGSAQLLVFDSGARRFAYVPRGPVVDSDDEDLAAELLDVVLRISAETGADFVRLEPQWVFSQEHVHWLQSRGFTVARQFIMPPRTVLVDLGPPIDGIWGGFRSNTRNRIRLAEKRGVLVRAGCEDDVPSFVRLFQETADRHGLRQPSSETLAGAARIFLDNGVMRLFVASGEGVDLAGIMVFLFGTTATYLWGASSADASARRRNPNQLLHWTAMQCARDVGCKTYDLFGVPDHDREVLEAEYARHADGWWNLYRFKRGFGGTVHRHVGTYDWVFRQS